MTIESDIVLKYLASAFIEEDSLVQDLEPRRRALAAPLAEHDMYLRAINFGGAPLSEMPDEVLATVPLIAFRTADSVRNLNITTRRLNYVIEGRYPKESLPTWGAFTAQASSVLATAVGALGISANRVAFVVEELATTRLHRQQTIGQVAERLLTIPVGIDPESLTEWQWRLPFRTERGAETYNLLPRVTHVSGTDEQGEFDGLHLEIDTNTYQGNETFRFSEGNLGAAFEGLAELASEQFRLMSDAIGEF